MKKLSILLLSVFLSASLIGCESEEQKQTNQLLQQSNQLLLEIKQLLEQEIQKDEEAKKKASELGKMLRSGTREKF